MGWQFWVDRGGTFTDLIACSPEGRLFVHKCLSRSSGTDPAVLAIRELLGLDADQPVPPDAIDGLRLGTTVATNALLEGVGEPLLLLTNSGLADLLRIGDQHRPDLFALRQPVAPFLAQTVLEVSGRLDAAGHELNPLVWDDTLLEQLEALVRQGIRQAAVVFLHAQRNPVHEQQASEVLRSVGLTSVVCSHQVSAAPRMVPRGQTALVETAIAPVLRGYLDQVRRSLGTSTALRVMTSSGTLQATDHLLAKDTILSGPAAGMVGAVAVARAAGFRDQPVLGFDMGGTSTDVFCVESVDDDCLRRVQEQTELAGLQLLAARLPIDTVAAGGGSIIRSVADRLQVGPQSAGARPGPACYRAGGPLTITDVNLLLGRLQLDRFPTVFGPNADQPPDPVVVREQFNRLSASLGRSAEQLAEGALQLTVERMADAVRRVSLHRGIDLRGGVLVAYGGASGQHACRLAEQLGLSAVLCHPLAGVLSAYGMGQAQQRLRLQRNLAAPLSDALLPSLEAQIDQLTQQAQWQLQHQGDLAADQDGVERWVGLDLRYPASDQSLTIGWSADLDRQALESAFLTRHQQRYGYCVDDNAELILDTLTVDVAAPRGYAPSAASTAQDRTPPNASQPTRWVPLHDQQLGWRQVPLWDREQLRSDQRLQGPALISDDTGCIVLEPGWTSHGQADGTLLLTHVPCTSPEASAAGVDQNDPVQAELYRYRFMAIAEQMGERLRQSSRSVNIRERLDFSCALFNGQGELVANAPHIPVHLGSMGESVQDLLQQVATGDVEDLREGDTWLSNDPFHGGTHLPDITAITPVFCGTTTPRFFVASRGHHADVGGPSPGSMPSFSTSIAEEGLLLRNLLLVRAGQLNRPLWQATCQAMPHPPRNPSELMADLQAQVAANQAGVEALQRLAQREGSGVVVGQMALLHQQAASAVRGLIAAVQERHFEVELDDGALLKVRIAVAPDRQRMTLDFSGTSLQRSGNFNAPLAVTKAAVLYVIRTLMTSDVPLNQGCFAPLDLVVPLGSMLNPRPPAAVVAGNVEVSQALCNLLFGAFGVLAAGQGTMNNLTFGDATRQYYETIAGGGGAGDGFQGSEGLQSHMTNSRITDPEVLEQRYPVRLERFGLRRGSGGPGRWRGGDGLIRSFCFLEPMTLSLISGSRVVPPFGLNGGEAGTCGSAQVQRADGRVDVLAGCAQTEVNPGDRITIATPGGGGFGTAEQSDAPHLSSLRTEVRTEVRTELQSD